MSHYFSYLKAKEELGYRPMVSPQEGMAATISYCKERKRRALDGPTIWEWLFVLIGMNMVFCAAFLPDIGPVPLCRAINLFVFRSIHVVRWVYIIATGLHIVEAISAWRVARKCDRALTRYWVLQTFLLGSFSLRYLLKRART